MSGCNSSEVVSVKSYVEKVTTNYNPGQNICYKVEKSSKVGEDFKSLLSNFACFLTAIVKV